MTVSQRVLAIGDIHGCANAFRFLLELIGATHQDTVVVLGDVIDRGPDSRTVIEMLIALQRQTNLITIMGNHDEMMLECVDAEMEREYWLDCGGRATLGSYGGTLESVPSEHIEFLRDFRDYWETETDIFVHANVEPGVPMTEQIFPWLSRSFPG